MEHAAARVGHLEQQHVLGQPALVAGDHGGDAQRERLLGQDRVAAVCRAERPDLAGLGEVRDVLRLVARPRDIRLAGRERGADAVRGGHPLGVRA